MDSQEKVRVPLRLELMTSCVTNKSLMELISLPTDRISHHTPDTYMRLSASIKTVFHVKCRIWKKLNFIRRVVFVLEVYCNYIVKIRSQGFKCIMTSAYDQCESFGSL